MSSWVLKVGGSTVLFCLGLGCSSGSEETSSSGDETPSNSSGSDGDSSSGEAGSGEQEVSSSSTCCLADGSAALLLFTEDEFLQLGEQLLWSENDQIKAERSRSVGQKGLDTLCGIKEPAERQEDIARWTEQMLTSAELNGGEEYRAILETKLGTCAP